MKKICIIAYAHYLSDIRVRRDAKALAERGDMVDFDGAPKYYNDKLSSIDIQCAAQAIQIFTILSNINKSYLDLSIKIAKWAIKNMRDDKGYFYYREHCLFIMNKIPCMRWGNQLCF